jgi:hypothetical protein
VQSPNGPLKGTAGGEKSKKSAKKSPDVTFAPIHDGSAHETLATVAKRTPGERRDIKAAIFSIEKTLKEGRAEVDRAMVNNRPIEPQARNALLFLAVADLEDPECEPLGGWGPSVHEIQAWARSMVAGKLRQIAEELDRGDEERGAKCG